MRTRAYVIAGTLIVVVLVAAVAWRCSPGSPSGGESGSDSRLTEEYVALGDSFAAGPGISPTVAHEPCYRSGVNYPQLVATQLGVKKFRDVTCSGARTENIVTTPQSGKSPEKTVPVQLDAVTPDTTLVTLTIGGNDAELIGTANQCVNRQPEPDGVSCRDRLTADGVDRGAQAVDAVGPKLAAVLDAIHAKAPRARIVTTSYGLYTRDGGCASQPVWPRDATYLQDLVDRLATLTRTVAAEHHAEFVDLIGPGAGHDGCEKVDNWVNGIVPLRPQDGVVPLHPTALGEANFARLIVAQLTGASG
ncbi:SGNH/GDSL hydrolase family protein [Nocardia inohanensis]|uniref:SGNH/GDSL hydrolase family protein n=1 Tax=Nocardia inohanensis TaxID=209246 RepID=UPI00082F767D|nr:SGNH/GDSL hydrolase family protein [Nocardia inohanensis]